MGRFNILRFQDKYCVYEEVWTLFGKKRKYYDKEYSHWTTPSGFLKFCLHEKEEAEKLKSTLEATRSMI